MVLHFPSFSLAIFLMEEDHHHWQVWICGEWVVALLGSCWVLDCLTHMLKWRSTPSLLLILFQIPPANQPWVWTSNGSNGCSLKGWLLSIDNVKSMILHLRPRAFGVHMLDYNAYLFMHFWPQNNACITSFKHAPLIMRPAQATLSCGIFKLNEECLCQLPPRQMFPPT